MKASTTNRRWRRPTTARCTWPGTAFARAWIRCRSPATSRRQAVSRRWQMAGRRRPEDVRAGSHGRGRPGRKRSCCTRRKWTRTGTCTPSPAGRRGRASRSPIGRETAPWTSIPPALGTTARCGSPGSRIATAAARSSRRRCEDGKSSEPAAVSADGYSSYEPTIAVHAGRRGGAWLGTVSASTTTTSIAAAGRAPALGCPRCG